MPDQAWKMPSLQIRPGFGYYRTDNGPAFDNRLKKYITPATMFLTP